MKRYKDDTKPWKGSYAPYDLVKEAFIAVCAVTAFAVLLSILFSSPDDKPSTIKQWSQQKPADFVTSATTQLGGTSGTGEYGPPYNNNGEGTKVLFINPEKWIGVTHPINTEKDFVLGPLESIPQNPELKAAVATWKAAPEKTKKEWTDNYAKGLEKASESGGQVTGVPPGNYGPVPVLMENLLKLAQSGGVDGALNASNQFFQTDYTKPLLFMADGGLLEERAHEQHLEGAPQWGMMNETGSYPGQVWLWLYSFWYQIEPFKTNENADLEIMMIMGALSLIFICMPVIPGIRTIPRKIPIYKLIWREHYAAAAAPPSPNTPEAQ
jgi:hypothetical protein